MTDPPVVAPTPKNLDLDGNDSNLLTKQIILWQVILLS